MRKLCFVIFFLIIYGNINAQQTKALEHKVQIPDSLTYARQIIDFLSIKTQYYFSYDSDLINDTAQVNFSNTDSIAVKKVIYKLSGTKNISFKITSSHVIITRKAQKPINNVVNGKVSDNGKPLYGATVYLKNSLKGVITNADGEFILKFPNDQSIDTLIVSYIGYFTQTIPIKKPVNKEITIELKPHVFTLNEIVVTGANAETIIRKMLSNFKHAYPKQNITYHTFYREEVKIEDNYKYFSEAVLEVFKNSYTHMLNTERIKVIQSRTFRSVTGDSLLLKIKSGLRTSLYLDVVRYQPDFLHVQTLDRYNYTIDEVKLQDNDLIYIISFRPKTHSEDALYTGKIFINGQSSTLKKVEFQYASHQKHKLKELLSNNYERLHVKPVQASYEIQYINMENTCYLQYINTDIQLKLRKKKDWFSTPISVKSSSYVVGVDTLNVSKPTKKETVNPSVVFSESNFSYEPEFWGKYNFLKPSNKVIGDLKKMIEVKKEVKIIP
ncbi:MAG: hypothetical protein C0599_00925 [Salinivirgaceae bacterium]|nr:MAG: hypothetical protein C0599_00925 [Salinivirgaceae bacterium]